MASAQDIGGSGSVPVQRLGDVMSRFARKLQEEHGDVEATLQAITTRAIGVVPNAEECGISYVTGRSKVEARASTSDLPGRSTPRRSDSGRVRAWMRSGSRRPSE